jgi:type II secretory pathway pseudopilin PulG
VIVALILGILAAVVVPEVINHTRDAILNATIADVDAIADAADRYRAQNGDWPTFTWAINAPGDFDGYLGASAFRKKPAIGTSSDGWRWLKNWPAEGIEACLYLTNFSPPTTLWQELDDVFDDGDLATGDIFVWGNYYLIFVVSEM